MGKSKKKKIHRPCPKKQSTLEKFYTILKFQNELAHNQNVGKISTFNYTNEPLDFSI